MEDATLFAGELLVKALVEESKDRLRSAMQVLRRKPTAHSIQEAVCLVGEAKVILIAADRIVTDD